MSLTDSYERIYQAIRRCHRFGQTRPVRVVIVTTDAERVRRRANGHRISSPFYRGRASQAVSENIHRKEGEVNDLKAMMKERMKELWAPGQPVEDSVAVEPRATRLVVSDNARMIRGDCVTALAEHVEACSVDYCVFSPPFQGLYKYSDDAADISNCADDAQFERHMGFLAAELIRVVKPGRLLSMHCMNIPRSKRDHGEALMHSLKDLRGQLVRIFEGAGFLLHSEVTVFRCPKLALVRTKAPELWHRQYLEDAAICRQALPDYVVTMRKPGKNAVPITHSLSSADAVPLTAEEATAVRVRDRKAAAAKAKGKAAKITEAAPKRKREDEGDEEVTPQNAGQAALMVSRNRWVQLASPFWFVNHNNTLSVKKALGIPRSTEEAEEEKQAHPTPMQLELIENCVELWSNEGDVVLDPFSGIGSTGHVAKKLGRRYIGCELGERYFDASLQFV